MGTRRIPYSIYSMKKTTSRKKPTPKTVKRLYALSGNICAFPGCTQKLVDENENIFAQLCHIEAAEQGGERYNRKQTTDERRSFENLILLCANHHIETNNIAIWSVKKLKRLKREHEKQFLKTPFKVSDRTARKTIFADYLESVTVDLDRSCLNLAAKALDRIRGTIESLNEDDIALEFGLLEARVLRGLNKDKEAEEKYNILSKIHPTDPRSLLYLAELQLNPKTPDENQKLLEKAEKIDPNHWLLRIEKLSRDINLGIPIDTTMVDEAIFPISKRERSICYRLYSICYEKNGDYKKADQFIEKAIQLNSDSFRNYQTKLLLMNGRLSGKRMVDITHEQKIEVLNVVNEIISKAEAWGSDNPKNMISLLIIKVDPLEALGKFIELSQLLDELLNLCLKCNFDLAIEEALLKLLSHQLSDMDFTKLLNYLGNDKIELSDYLIKALVPHFLKKGEILEKGKTFFTRKAASKALDFIKALDEKNFQKILSFIDGELSYKQSLAISLKDFPELRLELLNELSKSDIEDGEMLWLWLLHFYQSEEYEKAFQVLSKIDISVLVTPQYGICANIAHKARVWEKEVEILSRWLPKEESEKVQLQIQLDLFSANLNLGKYAQVISIGEVLLRNELISKTMNKENREILLEQTIIAHIKRNQYEKGLELLKSHPDIPHSFNFKSGIEADLHFRCGDKDSAIKSIVEGVKRLENPSPEQYGSLFLHLVQIGDKQGFSLDSEQEVKDGYFVKLRTKERWFHIGDDFSLDAVSVSKCDVKYDTFIGKNLDETFQFPSDKYAQSISKKVIEYILPLERYIFWKARQCFEELSKFGWSMGQSIEVPEKDGKPDLSNVIAFMEDLHKPDKVFFETYCSKNLPLASLAFQQGSLTNAIGKIIQEGKGFIRLSDGTYDENIKQRNVADKILSGSEVYLDATSALFLSETGLLKKIKSHISGLKVPQSVINFLFEIVEKFRISPGSTGYMGYANGKLTFNQIAKEQSEDIHSKIKESTEILEADLKAIVAISKAVKAFVWSEQQIAAALSDACFLAQNKKALVLTDDYLYLHINAIETKKNIPEYCSSFILMKTLLDKGLISFDDYLNYFSYLSSYRCRFLGLSVDDLMKAVFMENNIIVIHPENLRKFNLPLVLSKEYGVPLNMALWVVVQFLVKIISNDSISVEMTNKIFVEVIIGFLKGRESNKREVGILLSRQCKKQIKISEETAIIIIPIKLKDEKLRNLDEQINIFTSNTLIL